MEKNDIIMQDSGQETPRDTEQETLKKVGQEAQENTGQETQKNAGQETQQKIEQEIPKKAEQKVRQIIIKASGTKFSLTSILLVIVVLGVAFFAFRMMFSGTEDPYILSPAMLKEIKEVVKISTLEVQEEVGIKDSINGKHIFAKEIIKGYVNFDIEKDVRHELRNDTLIIYLPPEEVGVYEAMEVENAYEIWDEWNDGFFKRELTSDEENAMKKRWEKDFKRLMYERGHVRQARRTAVETLTQLFSIIRKFGMNIVVIDETPDGYYKQDYMPDVNRRTLKEKRMNT